MRHYHWAPRPHYKILHPIILTVRANQSVIRHIDPESNGADFSEDALLCVTRCTISLLTYFNFILVCFNFHAMLSHSSLLLFNAHPDAITHSSIQSYFLSLYIFPITNLNFFKLCHPSFETPFPRSSISTSSVSETTLERRTEKRMSVVLRKRLGCCTKETKISIDFDVPESVVTYNGLESFPSDNRSCGDESITSRGDGCITDSFNDDDSSCCSSSKDAFGSFSSKCLTMKRDEQGLEEWELPESPPNFYLKHKSAFDVQSSDVEAMKEKFAKLLLGGDITGGSKGLNTALALSTAITSLAVTVFGELWKLEPLSEERKSKWQREMGWLLLPTNYMVELVPAKQNGANGGIFEIMTPKARADIQMNLPALQKLDSMLIETLDSMVNTEFWYAEEGSRSEGRNTTGRQSKRWWLPSPRVPRTGLSEVERKRLLHQGRIVHQIFKAAKSINDNMLLEIPVPSVIKDALLKSGKASLGEELHKVLMAESIFGEEMLKALNLKSEHAILETINKLEAATFSWKERIIQESSGKSPIRTSWSFLKDPVSGIEKMELLLERAETLLNLLKTRHPNLPQTFLDAAKVQYGKDIGHSILEAYSRVLGSLAFSILSRIGDILQEDAFSNPNSPISIGHSPGTNLSEAWVVGSSIRHSLIDKMNEAEGQHGRSSCGSTSDIQLPPTEASANIITATPSRRLWCMGRNL